ncbi:uncharacterized protein LOC141685524 [Apium graveolens]|uniref:uncharacterized protein LOC141685524 n=1 Tax=Apium graveolens TaxID=4045 RepID=UPI003D7A48E7
MSVVGDAPEPAKTEMIIEFDDPNLEGLKFPLNDFLVITSIIGNCVVKRVLFDNGASMDILFHDTILRMGYNDSLLTPYDAHIYGFNGVELQVKGAIQLPMTIGEEPREATQMLNFQVVKASFNYNAVLGRTRIQVFKVVASTYNIVLKFPTRNGAGEKRGNQEMAGLMELGEGSPNRRHGCMRE